MISYRKYRDNALRALTLKYISVIDATDISMHPVVIKGKMEGYGININGDSSTILVDYEHVTLTRNRGVTVLLKVSHSDPDCFEMVAKTLRST